MSGLVGRLKERPLESLPAAFSFWLRHAETKATMSAMHRLEELVDYYVQRLSGPEAENAWHSLVEEGPAALTYLLNFFASTKDKELQIRLIQIVCQYRSEKAIPFLEKQLHHPVPEIWKTALDGLVMIGTKTSLELLAAASLKAPAERREWIQEAMQQIHEGLDG